MGRKGANKERKEKSSEGEGEKIVNERDLLLYTPPPPPPLPLPVPLQVQPAAVQSEWLLDEGSQTESDFDYGDDNDDYSGKESNQGFPSEGFHYHLLGSTADSTISAADAFPPRNDRKRSCEEGEPSVKPHTKVRRTAAWEKDVLARTTGLHTPSIRRHKDGKDHRKRCRVCKQRKTDLICYECGVPLCVNGYESQNCWFIFHNHEVITKPTPIP